MRAVSQCPQPEERIRFFWRASCLQQLLDNVEHVAGVVKALCDEIFRTTSIRTIFSHILSLGNTLNAGSYAANASGFKLDLLAELHNVRGTGGEPFMRLLAKSLLAAHPAFGDTIADLPSLSCGLSVSLDAADSDLAQAYATVSTAREVMSAKELDSALRRLAESVLEGGLQRVQIADDSLAGARRAYDTAVVRLPCDAVANDRDPPGAMCRLLHSFLFRLDMEVAKVKKDLPVVPTSVEPESGGSDSEPEVGRVVPTPPSSRGPATPPLPIAPSTPPTRATSGNPVSPAPARVPSQQEFDVARRLSQSIGNRSSLSATIVASAPRNLLAPNRAPGSPIRAGPSSAAAPVASFGAPAFTTRSRRCGACHVVFAAGNLVPNVDSHVISCRGSLTNKVLKCEECGEVWMTRSLKTVVEAHMASCPNKRALQSGQWPMK